uniref:Ion transport domain-containing protein n=1 Tax=Arcella intermedia TaxID=1963864 RepID=A0A6B2L7D6_9EUKA|eukprot:TRINITY_DN11359_c0_g1_i1.p1 TRINITY_DN11359_c0_g1~~TRINITY_DN11359_c0_g1_i1.p1  ORF type:complete len:370 (-),score=41.01 TRINITY_DN11359_c0_g1_i1:14-1123(-)
MEEELMEDVDTEEEEELVKGAYGPRDVLIETLQSYQYSPLASLYALINLSAILFSTISFIVSTLPQYKNHQIFDVFEFACVGFFILDYLMRLLLTRKHRIKWFLKWLNLIDLLSILPFCVEYILLRASSSPYINSFVVLRVLRLLRILRIIKLVRYSKDVQMAARATRSSTSGFLVATTTLLQASLIFASFIYFAEQTGSQWDNHLQLWVYTATGKVSSFQSIPQSMWWSIVTISTTGYGDFVPQTPLGKFFAGMMMLCSVFLLIFPLTMISGKYKLAYQKSVTDKELRKERVRRNNRKEIFQNPAKRVTHLYREVRNFRQTISATNQNILSFKTSFGELEYFVYRLKKHYERCEEEKTHNQTVSYMFY